MLKFARAVIAVLVVVSVLPYLIPTQYALVKLPDQPFTESAYVRIDDTLLHFRLWLPDGPIQGKVLMVHGFGGSTFSWRYNVEPLVNEGYLVVAVDLPGFGYSDRASNVYGQVERGALLWKLLGQIEQSAAPDRGDLDWHLMGHSMGGGTVAAMSTQEPGRTASVILVAGALFSEGQRSNSVLMALPPAQRWLKVALTHVLATPGNIGRFLSSAYGRQPQSEEIEGYLAPLRVRGTGDTLRGLSRSSRAVSLDRIADEEFPVLAIWGERDSWVPSSQGQRLKQVVSRTKYVEIEGAGHCPMETHVEEFNRLVLEFLHGR